MRDILFPASVTDTARRITGECLGEICRRCMAECPMMGDFGPYPGEILRTLTEQGSLDPRLSYSCTGCGNCTLVCPNDLPLRDVFLGARPALADASGGHSPFRGHTTVRFHQHFGFSGPFTTTVSPDRDASPTRAFMAGCSLSSSAPEEVGLMLRWLQKQLPGTGAVQKCCGLPTKNMGQEELFEKRFASLQKDLDDMGIEELIVACQNCKNTVETYGTVQTRSLWEVLPEIGIPDECRGKGRDTGTVFTVHDSCPTRNDRAVHDGIRWLMNELGYEVVEAEDAREKTRCCGAGSMAGYVNPEARDRAVQKRLATLPCDNIVVYCGTCRSTLAQGGGRVWHILDLLFGPPVFPDDDPPENVLARTASAWKNRYHCKQVLERT